MCITFVGFFFLPLSFGALHLSQGALHLSQRALHVQPVERQGNGLEVKVIFGSPV